MRGLDFGGGSKIKDDGAYRTALATPGLLNSFALATAIINDLAMP